MPKFIAIAATTLDGKIAKDSRHLSTEWTSEEDKKAFRELLRECGVILIGSKTFETAKGPLSKRNCIVLTRKVDGIKKENDKLVFLNTEKADLGKYIREQNFQKVAILGGAQVYAYCLENNLFDELYLTVEPIVFGQGINLFGDNLKENFQFQLQSIQQLNQAGTLLLHYLKA